VSDISAREVQEGEEVRERLAVYRERYFVIRAAKRMMRVPSSVRIQFSSISPCAVTSLL